jgi:hypothetical protein
VRITDAQKASVGDRVPFYLLLFIGWRIDGILVF